MNKTKIKILNSALLLFNQYGSIDVILQKIADESGISLGNLTYHFKNKEEIIISLFNIVDEETKELLNEITISLSEDKILDIEYKLFEFQEKYRFLFLDTINLIKVSDEVAFKFRESVKSQVDLIVALMNVGVLMETFIAEKQEGNFIQLAKIIWNVYFNRVSREEITGEKYDLVMLANDLWIIIEPYLTTKGKTVYGSLIEKRFFKVL